jgi:abhydrolase domain-containing protein 6
MNMSVWLFPVLVIMALLLAWWLLPSPVARALLALERAASGLRSRHRQVGDIDWHYLEGGQGEALVLLHGFNADAHHFARLARHLRGRFHLLAPDLPGFGDTGFPEGIEFDIESQADRLLEWLDALGIDRCCLGGNSMGGYLATAVARKAPERVRALWLLAPGGLQEAPYAELFQEVEAGRHNPLVIRHQADFDRLINLCFVHRPWMPRAVQRHLAMRAAAGCQRSIGIFDALRFQSPPLESYAAQLDMPALLLWGDQDRVLHPAGLKRLSDLLPDREPILLQDTGHLPQLERPRECARAWTQFAEQHAINSPYRAAHTQPRHHM